MMSILEIVELVVIAVVALGLIIYYLIMAIKNNWLKKITDALNVAIKEAEASGKSGKEKKEYVLAQVEAKCKELGIPYALIKKLISKVIDKIIANYNAVVK